MPEPRAKAFGYLIEAYLPAVQTAVHQCNADKQVIRDLYGSDSGEQSNAE